MSEMKLSPTGAFALLCVATLTIMVGCAIAPALPEIAAQVGMAHNASWLITLPSLGVVLFGPLAGDLIDRFGARKSLQVGLVLYGFLGIIGAFIPRMGALLLDRFLLGGATAAVMAAGTTLISQFYDGDARLKMIAKQGMAIELGGVIFLAIGGYIATIGWRLPFALYIFGWIFLMLVTVAIPEPGKEKPLANPVPDNGGLMGVSDIYFAACASQVLFFTGVITLPKFLVSLSLNAAECGYFLAFMSVIAVLVAGVMPKVQAMLGQRNTILTAFGAYCVAHIIFATSSALPVLIIAGILMGIGFGLTIPLANFVVIERSSPAQRGRFLAILSVAIFLGQFLSSFLDRFSPGMRGNFHLASLLAVAAFVIYWALSSWVSAREPGRL